MFSIKTRFQPTGRRDHSSPVASATIEPGWRIAPTHNLRRNQSLDLALVGSIVATRRGKYLTRNRGLKPTAKFIRPLRGGRNRAEGRRKKPRGGEAEETARR